MTISKSDSWQMKNLAHRYTVSFFKSQYGDNPTAMMARHEYRNQECNYFNIVDSSNKINATICAALLVTYVEAQGIPYHTGKNRAGCFRTLENHLKDADGTALYTADIVDDNFQFFNE